MKIELKEITIREVVENYIDSNEEGVYGYNGKLNIRPKYQREFVYDEKKRNAVIETIQKNFPLNVMYWVKNDNGTFEVLDGQQRTISFCQYVNGDFSINEKFFHNLTETEKNQILDYKLMIYICEGNDKEKLDWFKIINIAGEQLMPQELRNAVYTGSWLTSAKTFFSKSNCVAYLLAKDYVVGSPIRQEYLQTAISWINKGKIEEYMSLHQHDVNANELWLYFKNIIDWVKITFPTYRKEMKGLNWGELYEKYSDKPYDIKILEMQVEELMQDFGVTNKKGIFECVLGNLKDTKLLNIRIFDERTKQIVYKHQTEDAIKKGVSNCPLCAIGNDSNKTRIWELSEMDADHVAAWSKGGSTDIKNCQMLCKTHNRAKGNK
ncbi:MAG: DUF262 domain-containing protein [Clostridia bacterium]|nr:DUF262 domain-containing protein [Clostridia bacterium]